MALPKPQPGPRFYTSGLLNPPDMGAVANALTGLHFANFQMPAYELSLHLDEILAALQAVTHAQGTSTRAPLGPGITPQGKSSPGRHSPDLYNLAPGNVRNLIIYKTNDMYESLSTISEAMTEVSAFAAGLLSQVTLREATRHTSVSQASPSMRMSGMSRQGNFAG